jgi:hypothetical protein
MQQRVLLEPDRKKGRSPPLHLGEMPFNLRSQICQEILTSKKIMCMDVSTDQNAHGYRGLFPIKGFMGVMFSDMFLWAQKIFESRLRLCVSRTPFENFKTLEPLNRYAQAVSKVKHCQSMRLLQRHGKLNVGLELDRAAAATLSDVRIDDAALLRSASPICFGEGGLGGRL